MVPKAKEIHKKIAFAVIMECRNVEMIGDDEEDAQEESLTANSKRAFFV